MRLKTIVALIAAVIGIGGSVAAYQLAARPSSDVAPAAATTQADKAAAPAAVTVPRIVPAKHFVWAPCQAPAVLKGDRCVTEVVQTVTLPSTSGGSTNGGSTPSHQGGGAHQDDGDDDSGPSTPPGDDDDDHGDDDDDDEDDHDGGDHGGEDDD